MMAGTVTKYEAVIGLEVHAQLQTNTKLFCGDSAGFGAEPNTHVSPVTLAHPGTLPVMNRKVIEHAVRLGIACDCQIERYNYFARKNYFYPDLPKGYQISQHTAPVCIGGHISVNTVNGTKKILLNRIHIEEDAGKSMHDADPSFTCVDFNRSGVPLLEIVTEPCLHSSDEAYAFLTELRKMVRYLGVCDGNMEEGSMRCDANISIRPMGVTALGTKVEIKNLNSIRNVKKAIDTELQRLVSVVENGGKIVQETRGFDAATGATYSMRSKEAANDYRYFPDPDLTPFSISAEFIKGIKDSMPALPGELIEKYTSQYQLSEYDAGVLTDEKEMADYFEQVITFCSNYKAVANWLIGPVRAVLNSKGMSISNLQLAPELLAELIEIIDQGKLNFSAAQQSIFPAMLDNPGHKPSAIAAELNLLQESDYGKINDWVDLVISQMPEKVAEYRKGKKGLMGLFVGEVRKLSAGKADPVLTNTLLLEKLNS